MNNPNTHSLQVKEININAIGNISNYFNLIYPDKAIDSTKGLEAKVEFTDFSDLISDISVIIKGIELLAIDSTAPAEENLEIIHVLSKIVRKISPLNEMEFLDNLIFKNEYSQKSKFINIEEITKL